MYNFEKKEKDEEDMNIDILISIIKQDKKFNSRFNKKVVSLHKNKK